LTSIFTSSFAVILRVDSQIVRMLEVIFPKSLIDATMQDGSKRERRAITTPLSKFKIKKSKIKSKNKINENKK